MNRKIYLVVLAVLALTQCATNQSPLDQLLQEAQLRRDGITPSGHTNLYDDAASSELNIIAASGGRAKRVHDTLTLTTGGAPVALKNYDDCKEQDQEPKNFGEVIEDRCFAYYLKAAWPQRHMYLVMRVGFEFLQYMWIDDRDGRRTILDGLPALSPHGDHMVVYGDNDINSEATLMLYELPSNSPPIVAWANTDRDILSLGEARVTRWDKDAITLTFKGFPEYGSDFKGGTGIIIKERGVWALKVTKRQ